MPVGCSSFLALHFSPGRDRHSQGMKLLPGSNRAQSGCSGERCYPKQTSRTARHARTDARRDLVVWTWYATLRLDGRRRSVAQNCKAFPAMSGDPRGHNHISKAGRSPAFDSRNPWRPVEPANRPIRRHLRKTRFTSFFESPQESESPGAGRRRGGNR